MNMRKTTKIWFAGLVLLCALNGLLSCRKENLNGSHTTFDSTAIFSATIDGTEWQTDSVSAFLVGDYRGRNKVMTLTGYTTNRVISISLLDTSKSGNDSTLAVQQYPLANWGNASAFGYAADRIAYGRGTVWQQEGTGISGTADVTSSDSAAKRITGTFNFIARVLVIDSTGGVIDSVNVTNGVFKNIPYSYLKHQ